MASSALGFTLGDATNAVLNSYVYVFSILVGGVNRTSTMLTEGSSISLALGQPGSATIRVKGGSWTPACGQPFAITLDGSAAVNHFVGTINAVRLVLDGATTATPIYELDVTDRTWLLARYALVYGEWNQVGINTVVRDIVGAYTNGGFTVGYVPAALGDVQTYRAEGVTVSQALDDLAALAGAYWNVDAYGRVHMFQTPDHLSAGGVSVTNTSVNVMDLAATTDYADIATRVCVAGAGTTLSQDVAWDGDYLWVDGVDPFDAESGTVLVGGIDVVSYSAINNNSLVRNLVASTDRTRDWPAGTEVRAYAVVDDSAAQTALATALGFGRSGIAVKLVDDPTLTYNGCVARGTAELARYADGYTELRGSMCDSRHTDATNVQPGATITVNITAPVTVSGTYRVQTVDYVPRWVNGAHRFVRTFMAAPTNRTRATFDRVYS